MRIFQNQNADGSLFEDTIILPYELKEEIESHIKEILVNELENFGMPARSKPDMQQLFGQLQRDTHLRQKMHEWFWRGVISLLVLDKLKVLFE